MEKLKMHSPDMSQENITKIRDMFPDCVTEARDQATGQVRLVVDFDLLRQELSDHIVEGPQERYRLDWPGRSSALLAANAPIAKALRPLNHDDQYFGSTKNIFIEGDNLDALKLLQETYLGSVKLIYIDPPYNTGGDFVYRDDFSVSAKEYLENSNQKIDGDRFIANTETNGRFHSDWLSMMFSRLRLARTLLSDDGLIFISIDSHEVHRLRSLCDQVFGETSYKNTIAVRRGIKNVQAQFEDVSALSQGHEYVLLYAKSKDVRLPKLSLSHGDRKPGKWDTFWRGTDRPTMRYELFGYTPESGQWRWEKNRTEEAVRNYERYLSEGASRISLDEWYLDELTATNRKLNFVRKNDEGTVQYYVPPSEGKLLSDNWMDLTLSGNETAEFDTEKSLDLLQRIVAWATDSNANHLVMDFFAGSGTTGHAVMAANAADGGDRRFALVQLPVPMLHNKRGSDGLKTIADITRNRLLAAGRDLLAGENHPDWNRDVGFRILKIDTSNMQDVYYRPDQIDQKSLLAAIDNIKPGRTPEDLLFQVLVDWGVDLTLPIRRETIQGKTVFFVDENALVACFDTGVTAELVKELANREPLRVVFRDNGFVSDAVKINVEQVFRQLSPGTDVKSI